MARASGGVFDTGSFDVEPISEVACILRAPQDLQSEAARELLHTVDLAISEGIREVVVDLSATNAIAMPVVEQLEDVAHRLSRAGGELLIAARRRDAHCGYVMKRIAPDQLSAMLGVHPLLDGAVFRYVVFREDRMLE